MKPIDQNKEPESEPVTTEEVAAKGIIAKVFALIANHGQTIQTRTGWEHMAFIIFDRSGHLGHVSVETLPRLQELQRQHDKARTIINTHTYVQAKEAHAANQKKIQGGLHDDSHLGTQGWTYEDFCEDFQSRMDAAKEDLRRIHRETVKEARPIIRYFVKIANDLADSKEARDRAEFDAYGLSYPGPSLIITSIRKTAATVETRGAREDGQDSPRDILPFLPL